MNELLRRRKRLTELEVQCYLMQMISGLGYLHAHRVIHRDLKLRKFFLSDKMEIKIGDFDIATRLEFEGEKKKTICGTPNYFAPEVLNGMGYCYEVDVWSLGVVAYTLLVGKPPFETLDVKTTYRRIKTSTYSFPENCTVSEQGKNLITRILVTDPAKRPSLSEILSHEFFHQGNNIPKLLPPSTLACPPPASFLKQFLPNSQSTTKLRLIETTPSLVKSPVRESINELVNTELALKIKDDSNNKQAKLLDTYDNDIWVNEWADYSRQYGIKYLLFNGPTEVRFKDSTKIILSTSGDRFAYLERKDSDQQDMVTEHPLTEYPKELQKKVTLLQHFRSYLKGDVKIETGDEKVEEGEFGSIYVMKWMKTRDIIIFRLSNKIVQVSFQDHTEIILSSETRMVSYVSKKGERSIYALSSALESTNQEMTKRLKYTKEILSNMLAASKQADKEFDS